MLEPLSYPSSLTSKFAQAMKHERHQQRVLQAARAADYARMCSEQKLERAQRNCMYMRVALRVAVKLLEHQKPRTDASTTPETTPCG